MLLKRCFIVKLKTLCPSGAAIGTNHCCSKFLLTTWTERSSTFTASTKPWASVNKLEERDATQRSLDRLDRWACVNLMEFSEAKYKVLYLSQDNPNRTYRLGGE